jgi:hypothetical protein
MKHNIYECGGYRIYVEKWGVGGKEVKESDARG